MSHSELILATAYRLQNEGQATFTRKDIRIALDVNQTEWNASYSPVFQGMRVDPGGAPAIAARFRNTLKRVNRGVYTLTENGLTLVRELSTSIDFPAADPHEKPNTNHVEDNITESRPGRRQNTRFFDPNNYKAKVDDLLLNAENYHQVFYQSEVFGFPSLYFHRKALETVQDPTSEKHLEYVYATLVSWGMHRLGRGGPKMKSFETFAESVVPLKAEILEAQTYDISSLDDAKWAKVEMIFKAIRVMDTETSLVGNSKAMHHMLPKIIPPIDRQYTLSYLQGSTNIHNGLDHEWQLMKTIINNFFIPVAANDSFQAQAREWMRQENEFPWDSSILKIIDNLIVGAIKEKQI